MHTTLVSVSVLADAVEQFTAATLENQRQTRAEPGNLRFEVLQDARDPTRFILYEVFADEAAAAAHKTTSHYKLWKQTVAPWMERDRQGVQYHVLAQ